VPSAPGLSGRTAPGPGPGSRRGGRRARVRRASRGGSGGGAAGGPGPVQDHGHGHGGCGQGGGEGDQGDLPAGHSGDDHGVHLGRDRGGGDAGRGAVDRDPGGRGGTRVSLRVCQSSAMGIPGIAIEPVDDGNSESAVRFLIEWVSDGEAEARRYLADHAEPDGASLIATGGSDVIGHAAIVWESNYAGFRSRGIPLVHQIVVAGPLRRRGVATLLMDAAEQLARHRGISTLGITVGLFDEYGPAQRLYGRRGYIPDGRGACQGQRPLRKGTQLTMDDDLIIWLTKDLVS
jgi:GNAT superfamily N-acetyltransferase